MKFQAYRGVSAENPENTLAAVQAAVEQGYFSAKIDVKVTKDGQFVLSCDEEINRVARMPSGSEIKKPIKISDLTFEEALEYDFGIGFSRKFAGTRIAFLKDVLEFSKKLGIKLKIDSEHESFTPQDRKNFYDLLKDYQDTAAITCSTLDSLKAAICELPKMKFHYDGNIDENTLTEISKLLSKSAITVWLSIENVSLDTCYMVKRHSRLGLYLLTNTTELEKAEALGADIVETSGQLKPIMNEGVIADMHTHSSHSHDCREKMAETRAAQALAGTSFAAVTDHSDIGYYQTRDAFLRIESSFREVNELNSRNDSRCRLLTGVEIGDGIIFPDKMRRVEKLCDYDVIIGSIHCQPIDGELKAYSTIDFSSFTDEEVDAFMRNYFDGIKKMIEIADFDVLAHLTCPTRYITGRYGKKVHIDNYADDINFILKAIIKRGIALELNTSSLSLKLGDFVPHTDILKAYRDLGGYLVTIGSDAHIKEEASANFTRALKHLKSLGFDNIYYFKNRKPYQCRIV